MLVQDVMSTPALTVGLDESVKTALTMMDAHQVTSLPVVGRQGGIVGVVSEADVLRGRLPHVSPTQPAPLVRRSELPVIVAHVMSRPLTVRPSTEVTTAVDLMTRTAVKSLPVVDEGRIVGMISRSDVIHLLARRDADIHADVVSALHDAHLSAAVDVSDGVVSLSALDDPQSAPDARTIAATVAGVAAVQVFA